jgi:hypothetical protein
VAAEDVGVTGSVGVSTAVPLATGSAGRADFLGVDTMAAATMAATMGVDTMAVGTMADTIGVVFSVLDIRTITRFIIPITRIHSTGIISDTNGFRQAIKKRIESLLYALLLGESYVLIFGPPISEPFLHRSL